MNIKRLLCVVLAMLLALGATALADAEDLQAQLDAANERIAELEAEVALYKPVYEKQVVVEYGEDSIIWREDAMKEYQDAADAYAQYGLSIDDYADEIKQDILEMLVQNAVLADKTAELGLDTLDDETRAKLDAEAAESFETYVETYKSYFADEDADEETARQQTLEAMAQYGLTQETLTEQMVSSYIEEQLYNYITEDVVVDDADIQEAYEAMVSESEESFEDDGYSFVSAYNSGETIAWNPEGYRAVKHVLIKFDDDQAARYSELKDTLASLEDEKASLDAPADEEADEEGEADDAEPAPAPRDPEVIEADLAAVTAEIEALHAELLPRAQEVIDAFEAGTDFDTLIEQYNADPGMKNEPTATSGYAVSAASAMYDPAFIEGAMSIGGVGQISGPIYGSNGIHIIYYLSDIAPGAVPFEDIAEEAEQEALSNKTSDAYDAQVAEWVEEAHPVYHLDRF